MKYYDYDHESKIDTSDFLMACAKGSRDRQNNKGKATSLPRSPL